MKDLFILKVGGSAATEKDTNLIKAREEEIERIAKEIKKAKDEKRFKLVLVHGAGPFGHKLVNEYKINDGVKTHEEYVGFLKTHKSVTDLNFIYTEIFSKIGLKLFPVHPNSVITQENKRIKTFDLKVVKKVLGKKDLIPVMYGDMVFDSKIGMSVVSGDAILPYLARKLNVTKAFLGSDVEGIFDADPKTNPGAKLIKEITNSNFEEIIKNVEEAKTTDVTGGMKGKLEKLKENLTGIEGIIFDITKENNVYSVLTGKELGTRVNFK